MGTGVSVLSALKKGMQGWIRTASTRRIVRREKSPCGAFLDARLAISTRAHQELRYPMGTGVSVLSVLQKGLQGWIRTATATTAASGRNREELLGLRPVGCACRPRHDAAAGSRDPGSFSARLAQSTRAHQKTATYPSTLRFCFTMLFPAISASFSHQSSWARILFCTISPAGVRARMRPSKVAYPARTQFCTKASCAVENCLPYRVL